MKTVEQPTPELADMFAAVCEAAKLPPGAARIDVFLALPKPQQDRIWSELAARGNEGAEAVTE